MPIFFGEFTLDRSSRQLRRNREVLHVEPKAFELLQILIDARPAAVSKAAIRDRIWPDTFVSEASLTRLVAQLRRVLGDQRREALFIRTVHGFGYSFVGETSGTPRAPGLDAPLRHWVILGRRVIHLAAGANLVGRAEEAAVSVEAPGVSRRHAQIVVTGGQATLEDLGSKNGTFHHERRVADPVRLEDGDLLRVGRHFLTYRCGASAAATVTQSDV